MTLFEKKKMMKFIVYLPKEKTHTYKKPSMMCAKGKAISCVFALFLLALFFVSSFEHTMLYRFPLFLPKNILENTGGPV